jgi:hypothetical protein
VHYVSVCAEGRRLWPGGADRGLLHGAGGRGLGARRAVGGRLLRAAELWSAVALSLCTTAHPLHTRSTNIFGTTFSETTMRPNPAAVPEGGYEVKGDRESGSRSSGAPGRARARAAAGPA